MNIYLIHGEDELKARSQFNLLIENYRSRGYEVNREGSGDSLFSEKTVSVFENPKLYSKNLNTNDVIILYDGNAPATLIKSLPKGTKIEKFDLPKKLFAFLDNITLSSFHDIIKTEPIELVFAMLGRHFRDLYWVSVDTSIPGYQPWRVAKLKGQASKFTIEKLKGIIETLSEADVKAKTGEVDLITSLDLLLAKHLE